VEILINFHTRGIKVRDIAPCEYFLHKGNLCMRDANVRPSFYILGEKFDMVFPCDDNPAARVVIEKVIVSLGIGISADHRTETTVSDIECCQYFLHKGKICMKANEEQPRFFVLGERPEEIHLDDDCQVTRVVIEEVAVGSR
jgi:hypothetical protein